MSHLSFEQRVRARARTILPGELSSKVPLYRYDGEAPRGNLGVLPCTDDGLAAPRAKHLDEFFAKSALDNLVETQAEALAVHVLQSVPRQRATGKECLRPTLDEEASPESFVQNSMEESRRAKQRRKLVADAAK